MRTIPTGLFVCEGTSDLPIAEVVEALFVDVNTPVRLSSIDFDLLGGVPHDVKSRVTAGVRLMGEPPAFVVVHRDADKAGTSARRSEIESAIAAAGLSSPLVPVVPIRMTEAWVLLDEVAIRRVAGNPNGKHPINLPSVNSIEGLADPKQRLKECLLDAAAATGRRRDQVAKRFTQHRRQLLERLDRSGPVTQLSAWKALVADIETAAAHLSD